jgi:hypothetical protein
MTDAQIYALRGDPDWAEQMYASLKGGVGRNHKHAMASHFLCYNFVHMHHTIKMSPAMRAGISKRLWEMKDVVDMLEAWETTQ